MLYSLLVKKQILNIPVFFISKSANYNIYSLLKLSTGLATAAFIAW